MAPSTTDDRDGIVADSRHVPGTELLYDLSQGDDADANFVHSLQHVRKGDSHVLLVPQPSLTDPNDPLLWSRIKKSSAFANGLAYSFLGAVTGPIMAAGRETLLARYFFAAPLTFSRHGAAVRGIRYFVPKTDIRQRRHLDLPGCSECLLDVCRSIYPPNRTPPAPLTKSLPTGPSQSSSAAAQSTCYQHC